MTDDTPDSADHSATSPDLRQVALVAVVAVALVAAAFALPTVSAPGADGPEGGDDPEERYEAGDPAEEDGPSFDWPGFIEWLVPPDRQRPETTSPACVVAVAPEPSPGKAVTVTVERDGGPVVDAPVWFNGDYVGDTDSEGRVDGRVPYERELEVRVGLEGAPDCEATATAATGQSAGAVAGVLPVGTAAAQDNTTVSLDVDAETNVTVTGDPFPGDEVTVRASIDGEPLPGAAVTVDGEPVGETGPDGTLPVRVPDDGTETLTVAAERGEFDATTTVEVLLLEAGLRADGLAVVPGADAVAVARLPDRDVEGASVTVDGEPVGETGPNGTLGVGLPADPAAPVTVDAHGQTASTSVLSYYRLPGPLLVGLLVAGSYLAHRRAGRRGLLGVWAAFGAVLAVVFADAFYGSAGRWGAVAALVGLGVAAWAVAERRRVAAGVESAGGLLAAVVAALRAVPARVVALWRRLSERLLAALLWTAGAVGGAVDRLRRALGRLFGSSAGVLERLVAAVRWVGRATRTQPWFVAGTAVAALVAAVAGYAVADLPGLLAAVLGVVVAGLVLRANIGRERPAADDAADAPAGVPDPDGVEGRGLRELWRAFARAVAPASWRTRTPEEIARAAVGRGYPRRPVEELTRIFREVEYGGRSASGALRERAAAAYTALRGDDDGGDPP